MLYLPPIPDWRDVIASLIIGFGYVGFPMGLDAFIDVKSFFGLIIFGLIASVLAYALLHDIEDRKEDRRNRS